MATRRTALPRSMANGPGSSAPAASTKRAYLSGEGGRAFLQRRLALLSMCCCLISAGSYVFMALLTFPSVQIAWTRWMSRPGGWIHLALIVALAMAWAVCSRPTPLSRAMLGAIDVVITFALGLFAASIEFAASSMAGSWLFSILGLTNVVFVRTALLPSSALRTFWMSLVAAGPVIIGTAVLVSRGPNARVILSSTVAWCLTAIAVATVVSYIIYGLRKQVREAMQLGQYTLVAKIGEGGMGTVFKARHALLRRPTAIKLLAPERSAPKDIERFEREVQLTSQLTHPNTISIYDYGYSQDGVFYYAMEYLDGLNLQELVEIDGPQPPGRVVHILLQVLSALIEAHGNGLIHRDIKPANIILCERGGVDDTVKVVDFGLIKELRSDAGEDIGDARVITGTPHYMSPEAIAAPEEVDARTDLYAVGAVEYFLLTGREVFEGKTMHEVLAGHLHAAPVPPSAVLGKALPADLEQLLLRCLEKDKSARPDSAAMLHAALTKCRDAGAWGNEHARAWWRAFRAKSPRDDRAKPCEVATTVVTVHLGLDRVATSGTSPVAPRV